MRKIRSMLNVMCEECRVCVCLRIRWWSRISLSPWGTSWGGPWTFSAQISSAGSANMADGYVGPSSRQTKPLMPNWCQSPRLRPHSTLLWKKYYSTNFHWFVFKRKNVYFMVFVLREFRSQCLWIFFPRHILSVNIEQMWANFELRGKIGLRGSLQYANN